MSLAASGSDSAVIRQILTERSEIPSARSEFRRACAIREWIYANSVVSVPSRHLDRDHTNVYEKRAGEMLDFMRQGRGGFFCGGVARFAIKVYAAFDIRAFDINIGIRDTETTHVVNIVPVRLEASGEPIYTVQDAYLDYTLIGANGKPLDLREAVSRLAQGTRKSVIAAGGGGGLRPVLVSQSTSPEAPDLHPFFREAVRTATRAHSLPDGAALHWTPIMRPRLFEQMPCYAAQYQEPLQRLFGEVSLLDLLRLPLSTSGEKEIEDVVFGP